ncbi:MAG: hypothetical protein ACRDVP_10095 [Acidimicrobiales bacterium]
MSSTARATDASSARRVLIAAPLSLGVVIAIVAATGHAHLVAGIWAVAMTLIVGRTLWRWSRPKLRHISAFEVPQGKPPPRMPMLAPRPLTDMEMFVSQAVSTASDARRRFIPMLQDLDRGPSMRGEPWRSPAKGDSDSVPRAARLLWPEQNRDFAPALSTATLLTLDEVEDLVTFVESGKR